MKSDFIKKYISSDTTFRLEETGPDIKKQNFAESKFALGNGFVGSRGIYEENPSGCQPGTFIPGIFDKSGAQVDELVNLPNPINFILAVDGEKFDIFAMKILSHRRILDMKKAAIVRETRFKDAKGRVFVYRSLRFFSMDNPHIGAMKISLKLVKGSASLTAVDSIDDSVYNSGGLMMSKKRHFNTIKADKEEASDYIAFRTNSYRHVISVADSLEVESGRNSEFLNGRIHDFELKTNQKITFTKIFCIKTSLDYDSRSLKRETMRDLNSAVEEGFEKLFKAHEKAMLQKWEDADVVIEGDEESQLAVRFCMYHLIISAGEEYGRFSIGAKTLSGEGYKGHVFWDTEIYLLPFFIHVFPGLAKQLLMLRYNTLNAARGIAASKGYKGAMYPWESTPDGQEQTPRYAKGLDGSIGQVFTQDFEHHITADVAYGISEYCRLTGDSEFMLKCGAEIIFETARFWTSRVKKKEGFYHIDSVIGPDEFHVDVDDNAFTNYMASWNLERAASLYEELKGLPGFQSIKRRIKLKDKEVVKWRSIASLIVFPRSKKYGIITQFKSYLRKKDVRIKSYDKYFLPEAPKYTELEGLEKTRFLKQADVVLLFCLFPDGFSKEEKKINYDFYMKRTLHKSSLSFSAHSLAAAEMGDMFRAFKFFWIAANLDIMDIAGNTSDGIHAANLGGVWQALVNGFAGVRVGNGILKISPRLPGNFSRLAFNFFYQSDRYEIEIFGRNVRVRVVPAKNKNSRKNKRIIEIFGKQYDLLPFKYRVISTREEREMVTARDIMKKENMVTVDEITPVARIGRVMVEKKASSVPVVDRNNNIKGIVSEVNIIEATAKDNFSSLRAGEIMNKKVVSVKVSDPLEEITKTFTKFPYRRLPVLDGSKVVGIITRRDIIADFLGGFY